MKILMQQADAAGGGQGAGKGAGAAGDAGAAAGASGAAGGAGAQGQGQQQGQQQQRQQTGTTTDKDKGTGDTPAAPTPFVPKLPDGVKMDEAVLKEFREIQADSKLTPEERMQKTIDLQIKAAQQSERTFRDRLAAQPAKDLEALRADKDFGGPNLQQTIDGAQRIERLAFGEDLAALLKPLGMQSNPVILKGLARLSRLIAEDSVGTKTGGGPNGGDELAAMFPNSIGQMRKDQRK